MDWLLIHPDRCHKIPPLAEHVLSPLQSSVSQESFGNSCVLSHSRRVDVCGGCRGGAGGEVVV